MNKLSYKWVKSEQNRYNGFPVMLKMWYIFYVLPETAVSDRIIKQEVFPTPGLNSVNDSMSYIISYIYMHSTVFPTICFCIVSAPRRFMLFICSYFPKFFHLHWYCWGWNIVRETAHCLSIGVLYSCTVNIPSAPLVNMDWLWSQHG